MAIALSAPKLRTLVIATGPDCKNGEEAKKDAEEKRLAAAQVQAYAARTETKLLFPPNVVFKKTEFDPRKAEEILLARMEKFLRGARKNANVRVIE